MGKRTVEFTPGLTGGIIGFLGAAFALAFGSLGSAFGMADASMIVGLGRS